MLTLRERNRYLYIVHKMAMYDEPTMVYCWYPLKFRIRASEMHTWSKAIDQEMRELSGGSYIGMKDGLKYCLPDGGQTKSEFTEREPIPRPRGKTLEYRYGHWERYTKAKGWHRA